MHHKRRPSVTQSEEATFIQEDVYYACVYAYVTVTIYTFSVTHTHMHLSSCHRCMYTRTLWRACSKLSATLYRHGICACIHVHFGALVPSFLSPCIGTAAPNTKLRFSGLSKEDRNTTELSEVNRAPHSMRCQQCPKEQEALQLVLKA